MTNRTTAEKFFSPQKKFHSNFYTKTQNFTPNLTHNTNKEKNQNMISISSILPQKNQEQSSDDHISDARMPELIKKYAKNNDTFEQNNGLKNENNLNLMFKEWKIKKTNEMIERFEGQMQILLKENEKLMLNSKQKQHEIERLKASAFANNCKIKELESRNDIMKEELDHSVNLLREKEEDIQLWKSKFFESEQKVSVLDSLEYKTMENEYLLMEYQKKIDELVEENEKIKNFKEFTNDLNDQLTAIVEEIDNLCKMIQSPNETKKNIPSSDFLLNMSFQTPEKLKHASPLEHIQSQLKLIGSFLEISKNESPNKESIIRRLEKELENERKEKNALNSKIIFLRNAKFKDNKDNDKTRNIEIENEIGLLKSELEKKNQLYNELNFKLENSYKENESLKKNQELLRSEFLRNNENNEINECGEENDYFKQENEQLLLKITDLERNMEYFSRENSKLKADLLLSEQTIQNLKSKLNEDQKNVSFFQQKIDALNKELSDLLSKNQILSNKANELNEIIEKNNKNDLIDENENNFLKEKNHELSHANEELSHANEELSQKLKLHIEEIIRKNEEVKQFQNLLNEKEIFLKNQLLNINNNNNENLMKNKEELEKEKNDLLIVVQKLKEQLIESQKNSQLFSDSLDKARKETRLLFFLAVVVIICISLFFFMN